MTAHAALTQIISFGPMIFSGAFEPANTDNESAPVVVAQTAQRPQHVGPSNLYPVTDYGYGAAPLAVATLSTTLVLTPAAGFAEATDFEAVEDAFNTWWAIWTSQYLWDGNDTSGQVGDVCALDASGAAYVAKAELLSLETNNQPGESAQQIALMFALLTDMAAGTPATATGVTGSDKIPTKRLVSFGTLIFTGEGAPDNTTNGSTTMNVKATVSRPRHPVAGNPYGVSSYGLSAAPFTTIQLTTTLMLVVAQGLSQEDSMQALEGAWNIWSNGWRAVAGQIATLVVLDMHDVAWQALAELIDFPITPLSGEILMVDIPLTFNLLSPFTEVV